MRYAFVAEHRLLFSVRAMCRYLRIPRSGFYAWLTDPLSKRAKEDIRQIEPIRKAWQDSDRVYDYRKLHDDLMDLLPEPDCSSVQAGRDQGSDRLQASAGSLWRRAISGR